MAMKFSEQKRPTMLWLAVVLAAFSLLTIGVRAQQPQPGQKPTPPKQDPKTPKEQPDEAQTIKVGTQLVNVLFSATDKQNRYINDIQKEEVTILEDGKPQEIFVFKRETDLPLTMAIMIDVSGSEQFAIPRLRETGSQFVQSVVRQGKDTVAVIQFEGEATLLQGLTSNPARVRKALDEVTYIAPPPIGVFGGPTPPINGGSRQGGTSIYDAVIATCADLLAREPGRKTIILISDGEDTTSRKKIGDAIDEALRAEVVIYSIGIGDPAYGGINEGVLKRLCESTGGRVVIPKGLRDLDNAFLQLEQDLRQQYLLAYEPSNETPDGGFRKIELKVANRKDLRVRLRRGYYAPKG
jgi:Ca-activated chloride channel family protein